MLSCYTSQIILSTCCVYICSLILPCSIQNQKISIQRLPSPGSFSQLIRSTFPQDRSVNLRTPEFFSVSQSCGKNVPIVTITSGSGGKVHLQGLFPGEQIAKNCQLRRCLYSVWHMAVTKQVFKYLLNK